MDVDRAVRLGDGVWVHAGAPRVIVHIGLWARGPQGSLQHRGSAIEDIYKL